MAKYGFKIIGDNANGSPVLFECTFEAKTDKDLNNFRTAVFQAFDNPQNVGMPCSPTDVYPVKKE